MEVLRQLEDGLADRYRIDREIGAGGMATDRGGRAGGLRNF
jgi:hypothetical protein